MRVKTFQDLTVALSRGFNCLKGFLHFLQKYFSLLYKDTSMILGTRNRGTFMCKNLHTFVKVSIKITLAKPNHPKCKQSTAFPYKNLLSKKMNGRIFTDSFSRICL